MPAFYKFCANMNGAIKRQQVSVRVPRSSLVERVLTILEMEQFIRSFSYLSDTPAKGIEVYLAYKDNHPVLKQIITVSKPGRRVYTSCKALLFFRLKSEGNNKMRYIRKFRFSRIILSTSLGIMTDNYAILNKTGGEVICKIVV
jgi:small subunit ribosomal protein S8